MAKRYTPPPSPIVSYLDLLLQLTLLFQILSTALYFNGYFTNPLVNKFLLGEVLALTAWLFFLAKAVFEKRFLLVWSPYYIPALMLLVWSGIRSVTAPTPAANMNFYVFACILTAFPIWVTQFRLTRFRRLYVWALLFAGVCFIIGGLRQLIMENPSFSWSWFPAVTLSSGQYERQRLGAFLGHNNAASAYIWITTIYAGYLWYALRRYFMSALLGVYILFALLIIFYGGSRGVALMIPPSLLVIGIGLYFTLFSHRKEIEVNKEETSKTLKPIYKRKPVIIVAILGVALIILGIIVFRAPLDQKQIEGVFSRFQTSTETLISGTYPRVWGMSLVMVHEDPLLGVGFSAWPYQYPYTQEKWYTAHPQTQIGLPPLNKHTLRAHNDYLQAWAELGFIGLLCVVWLLFIHARNLYQIIKKRPIPALAIFAGAATIATLVRAIVAFPFHEAAASCLFISNLALFSWYTCNKEFIWEPQWLTQKQNNIRHLVLVIIAGAYLGLMYPINAYIVGDFGARLYTRWVDEAKRQSDPAIIAQYHENGLEYLKESLKYYPHNGEAWFTLGGETYGRAKNAGDEQMFLQAIEYMNRSLETYSYYDTYGHLGRAYRLVWEQTGKPEYLEQAIANFEKAVSIMPTFEEGWAQIGLLLAKSGKVEDALHVFAETEMRFSGFINRTIFQGARDMEANGDLETAATLYNIASTIQNASIEEHFQETVSFYLRHERPEMAVNFIAGGTQNQPPESLTKAITASLLHYLDRNEFDSALEVARELYRQEALQPLKEMWYYAGIVAWIAGNPVESVYCWEHAIGAGMPPEQLSEPLRTAVSLVTPPLYFP